MPLEPRLLLPHTNTETTVKTGTTGAVGATDRLLGDFPIPLVEALGLAADIPFVNQTLARGAGRGDLGRMRRSPDRFAV